MCSAFDRFQKFVPRVHSRGINEREPIPPRIIEEKLPAMTCQNMRHFMDHFINWIHELLYDFKEFNAE